MPKFCNLKLVLYHEIYVERKSELSFVDNIVVQANHFSLLFKFSDEKFIQCLHSEFIKYTKLDKKFWYSQEFEKIVWPRIGIWFNTILNWIDVLIFCGKETELFQSTLNISVTYDYYFSFGQFILWFKEPKNKNMKNNSILILDNG